MIFRHRERAFNGTRPPIDAVWSCASGYGVSRESVAELPRDSLDRLMDDLRRPGAGEVVRMLEDE